MTSYQPGVVRVPAEDLGYIKGALEEVSHEMAGADFQPILDDQDVPLEYVLEGFLPSSVVEFLDDPKESSKKMQSSKGGKASDHEKKLKKVLRKARSRLEKRLDKVSRDEIRNRRPGNIELEY